MDNNYTISVHSIQIEITSFCNFECIYCYNDSGIEKADKFLSFEKIEDILTYADTIGVDQIIISGGEPLLHNDILKIANIMSKYPYEYKIITNGSKVTQ